MRRLARASAWAAGAVAVSALLAGASTLLALAAVGVFATSGAAWTADVAISGARLRLNVVGLVRLATLPGVAHLLDGRSLTTRVGALRFARDGAGVRIACGPCRVQHHALAATPVDLRAATLALRREDDALHGALSVDTVRLTFSGRLRTDGIDLAWRLPATDLQELVRALGDAVPEAAYARIEGRVQADGTLALPARHARIRWSAEGLEVGGLGTEPLRYGSFRFACTQRDGPPRLVATGEGERAWLPLDASGPYLAAAVLAAEDQRFHAHNGIDEPSMAGVLDGFVDGRPARGASTITQQLARTLFTGGERSAVRKVREFLYAIEIERTLGKPRILELYLNTVDWGPGLCGARAAARAYFGKPPARLSAIEAAWLAGVLRNPHAAWAERAAGAQPDRARATQVLMQMRDWPRRERHRFAAQALAFTAPSQPRPAAPRPGLTDRLASRR